MEAFLRLDDRLLKLFRWIILGLSLLASSTLLLVKFDVLPVEAYNQWAFWIAFFGISALGILQFVWLPESRQKTLFYVIGYHILSLLSFMFVTGYVTLTIFIWMMLIVVTDLNFGRKAAALSASIFLSSIVVWFLTSSTTVGVMILMLVVAVFIIAAAMVVSQIRLIAESRGAELEQSREKERLERERLLALVNSMGDAVIATNEKGEIRIYNGAASSLLDTNVDLVGKPITRILHLRDPEGHRVNLLKLLDELKGNIVRTDLLHQFTNKERINLYMNIAIIHLGYQSQGERGYTFLLRDITKEKSLEQERDEFISVVSHELRTPIAIAEGSLSNALFLQKKGVSQEMINQSIAEAHNQVLFLSKMANDLATLSRAERGSDTLEVEQVDVHVFLEELRATYEPQAKEKDLKFVVKARHTLAPLFTSKLYLQEILQNFITNAIKYTKTGTVTVSVEATSDGTFTFHVKDSGIGISKSDQKHLFEKFFRSEDYRTRESSGTGLGLYLVHKLAQQLHAKIAIESRLNYGSTFSITVPPLQQGSTPPPSNEGNGSAKLLSKILHR